MTLDQEIKTLIERHEETVIDNITRRYEQGMATEMNRMASLSGINVQQVENAPEDDLGDLVARILNDLKWYDKQFRDYVAEDGKEALDLAVSMGVPLGTQEDVKTKWVEPDGTAWMPRRDRAWQAEVNQSQYFSWLARLAGGEAQSVGRVTVQEQIDEVEGHVWISELEDETSPVDARLHGVVVEDVNLHPPFTHSTHARIDPIFGDKRDPDLNEMESEREEWFTAYHKMRQGDAPDNGWSQMDVDVGEWSMEFLYNEYLPRTEEEALPTNAQ